MDDEFYLRFEDRFRGSRASITERVKAYLPMIEPLKDLYPNSLVVDVGCGRGEWLELLKENGWQVVGVDTNSSMVNLCTRLGLNAVVGDAVQYLSTVNSETVSVVSGFHIVEHLPFDLLVRLVQEAHRVLLPGGILILETPNPENYKVGAINFYMDPTHRHPLPPSLMQFLAEDTGFSKSVVLRLNGPEQPGAPDTAWALLANPDYSLVAQKQKSSNEATFQCLDSIKSEPIDFLALINNTVNNLNNELNGVRNELYLVKSQLNEIRGSYLWRVFAAWRKFKDSNHGRRLVDIYSRLFPLYTLPKRATQKITRLGMESGYRVINKIKSFVNETSPAELDFPMGKQRAPMSSQVRTIYADLVNAIETDNKKRNEQSKKD